MIVKFCGLRRQEDIDYVNAVKPDLVGFILVEGRRRYVAPDEVKALRGGLNSDIKVVGVFVDEDISVVENLLLDGIIDIAQLHGNESDDYILRLKEAGYKVIKAIGIRDEEDVLRADKCPADIVLLDTPGGGTGSVFDWDLLKKIERSYILAGGLNVDNVGEAVTKLEPYGVDVSSGIETDGIKDIDKMKAFMAAIKKG